MPMKRDNYCTPEIKVVSFLVENGLTSMLAFTERQQNTGQYELIGDPNDPSSTQGFWGTFN